MHEMISNKSHDNLSIESRMNAIELEFSKYSEKQKDINNQRNRLDRIEDKCKEIEKTFKKDAKEETSQSQCN